MTDHSSPAGLVLTASIARRYYVDGASKIEIAAEFGLSRFKVARLLEAARASGLVKVEISYRGPVDLALCGQLQAAFGLRHAIVVESTEEDATALRKHLGQAAATLLSEIVTGKDVLGLSWARSLMAMRGELTQLAPCTVVQLTGALSRPDVDESSIELVREVARLAGGPAFFFYAPMILPDAQTAQALRRQPQVANAMARYASVTKAVIGLGSWDPPLSTVCDAIPAREYEALRKAGVRAELSGVLIGDDGRPVPSELSDRIIGVSAEQMRQIPDVIAIVYGTAKAAAVEAAVRGGLVKSLVTHTSLARELLTRHAVVPASPQEAVP
ncbi:MAG: sugar-binding domain-containing protein [Pseudonocardiales bacterium]